MNTLKEIGNKCAAALCIYLGWLASKGLHHNETPYLLWHKLNWHIDINWQIDILSITFAWLTEKNGKSAYHLKQLLGILYHCMKHVQLQSYFWSVFSCTRTKYGDLGSKSRYSIWMQESTDQK